MCVSQNLGRACPRQKIQRRRLSHPKHIAKAKRAIIGWYVGDDLYVGEIARTALLIKEVAIDIVERVCCRNVAVAQRGKTQCALVIDFCGKIKTFHLILPCDPMSGETKTHREIVNPEIAIGFLADYMAAVGRSGHRAGRRIVRDSKYRPIAELCSCLTQLTLSRSPMYNRHLGRLSTPDGRPVAAQMESDGVLVKYIIAQL